MKELPQNFAEHAFRAHHVLATGIEERVLRPTADPSPADAAPKDDGGPAFPHMSPLFKYDAAGKVASRITELDGMSLRDWFAGQIMAGANIAGYQGLDDCTAAGVAKRCYEIADALLAERSKRSGS